MKLYSYDPRLDTIPNIDALVFTLEAAVETLTEGLWDHNYMRKSTTSLPYRLKKEDIRILDPLHKDIHKHMVLEIPAVQVMGTFYQPVKGASVTLPQWVSMGRGLKPKIRATIPGPQYMPHFLVDIGPRSREGMEAFCHQAYTFDHQSVFCARLYKIKLRYDPWKSDSLFLETVPRRLVYEANFTYDLHDYSTATDHFELHFVVPTPAVARYPHPEFIAVGRLSDPTHPELDERADNVLTRRIPTLRPHNLGDSEDLALNPEDLALNPK
ncbi:hypothetical protein JCM5353_005769 [Sporobolomyces roseus]